MVELIKEPEQLTTGVTMIGTSSWGSQTGGIGSVMGSTWSEKIILDAEPNRIMSKYFMEITDLIGNNDVTIILPKIGDVNLMGGRSGSKEGVARVMTKFDSADNITVSLTSADVKLGGCSVSFETAGATRVSILKMAHDQLVRQYYNTIETDAFACLEAATIGTSNAGSVFGGSDVSDNSAISSSLSAGDIISVDKLADMRIILMEKDFAKGDGDAVLAIHPKQLKPLLKSSQFTNAAEFGSDSVVRKGLIEEYIGIKIETSTLVSSATQGVAVHYAYMIDPSAAAAIVWKEKAKVKVVTEDDERIYKVLLDAWYKMTIINDKAIVIGVFADA